VSDENKTSKKESASTVEAARDFASGFLNQVQTRLELFSNELAEERARLERITVFTVGMVFFGGVFFVLLSVFAVVAIDDQATKEVVFLGIIIFYAILAILCGIGLNRQIKGRGKPFTETIAEIRKDRERLGGIFNRDSD